jgi:hypothetical protein
MSTSYLPPASPFGASGAEPEGARATAPVQPQGHEPPGYGAQPTVVHQQPAAGYPAPGYAAPGYAAPTSGHPAQPGYGGPPAYAPQPGYGAPYGPPTTGGAPRRRRWIPWTLAGVALVIVAAIVGVVMLTSGGGTLIGISAQPQAIPDADEAGITQSVALDGSGTVQSLQVTADISHPYTCDLVVQLISPQGTTATVADPPNCDRAAPNLALRLDSTQPGSPLAPFVGQEAGGEWKIKVIDGVGADQGALQTWSVTAQAS